MRLVNGARLVLAVSDAWVGKGGGAGLVGIAGGVGGRAGTPAPGITPDGRAIPRTAADLAGPVSAERAAALTALPIPREEAGRSPGIGFGAGGVPAGRVMSALGVFGCPGRLL